jgi:hypothetical protein
VQRADRQLTRRAGAQQGPRPSVAISLLLATPTGPTCNWQLDVHRWSGHATHSGRPGYALHMTHGQDNGETGQDKATGLCNERRRTTARTGFTVSTP